VNSYRHTQSATIILTLTGSIAVVLAAIAAWAAWSSGLLAAAILTCLGWLFHSLTIEIADGELRWWFGPGWIHKRVPLASVASAKVVRTSLLEGWGIHYSRFGWLYNVSGFDAVAVTLNNGKRFCLGSDEAETLAAELTRRERPAPVT
jgi:hypothetical protein